MSPPPSPPPYTLLHKHTSPRALNDLSLFPCVCGRCFASIAATQSRRMLVSGLLDSTFEL